MQLRCLYAAAARRGLFVAWLYVSCLVLWSRGRYQNEELIPIAVNKVSPYNSPLETYPYYSVVPFCEHKAGELQHVTFSQLLQGDGVRGSVFNVFYNRSVQDVEICRRFLSPLDLSLLKSRIGQAFIYELLVDDVVIDVPLGFRLESSEGGSRYVAVTHLHFMMGYAQGYVVSVNVSTVKDLAPLPTGADRGITLVFRYSVTWVPDHSPVVARLYKGGLGRFFSRTYRGFDVQWLPIVNSFIFFGFIAVVLLLVVLRILRVAWLRWLLSLDDTQPSEEESGWKLLYADVFRVPSYPLLLSAFVGSGFQILLMVLLAFLFFAVSPPAGSWVREKLTVCGYPLTYLAAGYTSARLYHSMGGVRWKSATLATALLYTGSVVALWQMLDLLSNLDKRVPKLPFTITSDAFVFWLFETLPFAFLGGLVGRHCGWCGAKKRTALSWPASTTPRVIPSSSWARFPLIHSLFVGIIPSGVLLVTLHYVLASLWGPYVNTLNVVFFAAFLLHVYVTGLLSILFTYVHLNEEDYRWWWRSFVSGGSVGVYFFLYSVYYFFSFSHKWTLMKGVFFFSYALIIAWGIFQMMGFVTFSVNYWFVSYLYSRVKTD